MNPGQSPERILSGLLATQAQKKASGILTASRGKHKRLFCLENGDLIFAGSNMLEEQFESYLVQQEVIDQSLLESATKQARKDGTRPLDQILGAGVASDQELSSCMADYLTEQLQATLQWPDGDFRFAPGRPGLEGTITGKVSTTLFILEHVQNYPASLDKVRVRIGPPDIQITSTKGATQLYGLDPFQTRTLARCSDPIALPVLLEEYAGQEEEIYRTVYGMLITGLLKRVKEKTTEDTSTLVSREEAQAWLGKKETSDHYGILGVSDEATKKMIRDSYYSLARKMHPDRFRSGPLQDLLENVESFFTYVTDAYNTLIDPDRRVEYDRQLAEAGAERTEQTDSAWLARQNLLRGKELAARNKYSEAAGFMENALKQDENNPEILTHLGKLLTLNPRRRKEGEDYMIRAGELDPSATDSYLALAEFYIRTERFAEAEEQCRRTLKWEPDNGEAQKILAELQKGGSKDGLFRGLFGN